MMKKLSMRSVMAWIRQWISERRTRVNNAFKNALGANAAQAFLVQSNG